MTHGPDDLMTDGPGDLMTCIHWQVGPAVYACSPMFVCGTDGHMIDGPDDLVMVTS